MLEGEASASSHGWLRWGLFDSFLKIFLTVVCNSFEKRWKVMEV